MGLMGAQCPDVPVGQKTPVVHYLSLTKRTDDPFEASCGHRLVVLQCSGRVRILHAFKHQFSLQEYIRRSDGTAAMSRSEFVEWWGQMQAVLLESDAGARAAKFMSLLGAKGFEEDVRDSWFVSEQADVSGSFE